MNPILRKKLEILVYLALSDKEFADKERDFINNICDRNHIDPSVVEEILEEPMDIGSLGALSYDKSVEYLTDCLMLMLVDGKVLPGEILFCEDIAIRLGFPKKSTDELISHVSRQKGISRKRVVEQIQELPHMMK